MTERITPLLRSGIVKSFEKYRDPEKVAKALEVSLKTVKYVLKVQEYLDKGEGHGPSLLKPYLVAVKNADEPWDNNLPELAQAREEYDAGKVELCQKKVDDLILLYAIPRRRKTTRKPYFKEILE